MLEQNGGTRNEVADRDYRFSNGRNVVDSPAEGVVENGNGAAAVVESALEKEAWDLLRDAVVTYCGEPVGTIAANDPTDPFPLNYDQVFIRDFIPSAVAFLLKGETEIVRNFLLHTLQLQVLLAVTSLIPILASFSVDCIPSVAK